MKHLRLYTANTIFIVLLSITHYTYGAEVQLFKKQSWWACCSTPNPKKAVQKLNELEALLLPPTHVNPIIIWIQKKDIIRKAVDSGIHPDTLRHGAAQERFPLHDAIVHDDREFTLFLLKHGANLDQKNKDGVPVIFNAQDCAIVRALLDHKADVLVKDPRSQETLLHACLGVGPSLITQYCQAGGDPCAVDAEGRTALYLLLEQCPPYGASPKSKFLELLVSMGTPLDIQPPRRDTLHQKLQIDFNNTELDLIEMTSRIRTIITAAQMRKDFIRTGIGTALSKDTLGLVLVYDGQITDLTSILRCRPLKDSHGNGIF